jgi:chloramphenicol 3-O-phosphotransferase
MSQKLVILRGAACSGKTTIAESIRNYDGKIAWISIDNFKRIFSNFLDSALDDVNKSAVLTLNDILNRGFSVIADGIFKKPEHLHALIAVAKEKNIPFIIYQLDCSLETLKKRDKTRKGVKAGWFPPLGDELIESLYRKVVENPIENAIHLDTEKLSLEECIRIVKKNFE